MDLMTLAAKIKLDDGEFRSGVSNAEGLGERLAGKMSAMTVAVGNLAADMLRKGIDAVSGVVSGAIDGYADWQQLTGGVETLFKESASIVEGYAEEAYKTAGVSANEYMEIVTSYSAALLQGLDGDTRAAAEYANLAMIDMADNANKMGTDISSIQAAYQGFAKGNFTMLDNLKLGYGGTREEMVRLVNDSGILSHEIDSLDDITFDQLVLAIHEIQTEMGITGTTAKEAAETISGSKASLAAAWENLLTAVGGAGGEERLNATLEAFKESFTTYMNNFLPTLVETIVNSGTLVDGIAEALSSLPTTLLSEIGSAGLEAGEWMISGVGKVTNWLIDSIANMFKSATADPSKIEDLATSLGEFIGETVRHIAENIPTFLEGIITIGNTLASGLIKGLFEGLFGSGNEVDEITKALQEDLTDIDVNNVEATAILKYMDSLYEKFGDGVKKTNEWKDAQRQLEEVLPGAGEAFESYGKDIQGAIDKLKDMNEQMRQQAIIAGMQKALQAEQELLGEQLATEQMARTRADIASEKRNAAQEDVINNLKAYAQAWWDEFGADEGISQSGKQEVQNLLSGKVYENGELVSIENASADTLSESIMTLSAALEGSGKDIWNESDTDRIYDPEELDAVIAAMKSYQVAVDEQTKIADDAATQAKATQDELNMTQAALVRVLNEAGLSIEGALTGIARRIESIQIPTGLMGAGGETYMMNDIGLDYVPYNGFKSSLHKGEAILTRAEADKYRAGGNVDLSGLEDRIENAIRNGMANAQVHSYLNGKDITDAVNRNNMHGVMARRYAT